MTQTRSPIRLSDIGKLANVSKVTVARVLHGSGAGHVRVSEETARRVRQIAQDMGYQPNKLAQKLAGGQSHTLGVIVDSHAPQTNLQTLQHVERQAAEHGYRVMISRMHDDPDLLVANYRDLNRHGVDGVICISHDYPRHGDGHYASLSQERHLVFLGKPQLRHMPYVEVCHDQGIVQAVEHLQRQGRQRIGIHLYATGSHAMKQRVDGYHQALNHAGNRHEPLIFQTSRPDHPALLADCAQHIARDFVLPQKLDALIASNDLVAGHLIKVLQRLGVKIPCDLAIIGHDNQDFCDCFSPSITTLDPSGHQQAHAIITLCLGLIRGDVWSDQTQPVAVKPTLILRESA